jgi:hypothetical protein
VPAAPPLETPAGGLTPEAREAVTRARERARPVFRAARIAAFNGWTLGVIATLSIPFAFFSIPGALVTIGLAVVAYNEFRGRRGLLALDPGAAKRLGWNQVALLTLVVGYCAWMLWLGLTGEAPMQKELEASPELQDTLGSLGDVDQLYRALVLVVYGTIFVVTVVVQGANSLYYFTRRKYVEAFLRDTPEWAVEMQRITAVSR